MNILVIDSGIGGLYTLKILMQKFKNNHYYYFKDSINCPYGSKSKEQLLKIAINNIKFAKNHANIQTIVLACNTLSTTVSSSLKTAFKLPIFAVVPPIEQVNQNALVLCTPRTLNSLCKKYSQEPLKNNSFKMKKNNFTIYFEGFNDLALLIEKRQSIQIKNYLTNNLNKYKYKQIKQVILGCTHYNYVKKEISEILKNVTFFEGSNYINLNKKY